MHYFQILSLLKEKIKTPLRIVFATATENIIDTSKTCILILERHNDKQNNQKLAELIISSGLNFKNLIKEGLSSIEKNQKLETLSLDKLFDLKLDLTNILFNKLNSNPVIAEDESEFINFLVLSYTYNSFFKDDFAVEQNRLENLASQYDQEKIKQSSQKIMSEIKSDKLVIDSSSNLLRISHKQIADEELVIKTFIAIQNSLKARDQAITDSYLKLSPGLHLMILGALHFENIAKSMKENNQNLIAISANP